MNPADDERGANRVAGGNRFAFVGVVRQRAAELTFGAPSHIFVDHENAVATAISEAAEGYLAPAPHPNAEPRAIVTIVCRMCGAEVHIRRREGVAPQGRLPSLCADDGLSAKWEQIPLHP